MRSQGRQGNGTPKGRETRNVTIDLQREFIVFGGQERAFKEVVPLILDYSAGNGVFGNNPLVWETH